MDGNGALGAIAKALLGIYLVAAMVVDGRVAPVSLLIGNHLAMSVEVSNFGHASPEG